MTTKNTSSETNVKHSFKIVLVMLLTIAMLLPTFGEIIAIHAGELFIDNTVTLQVQDLPEMEYIEGMPYVGFVTTQVSVDESGKYNLTIRRTGDVSKSSSVELQTIDVSASYDKDYYIDDIGYDTKVMPSVQTLVQQYGNEANRIAAERTLADIVDRMSDDTESENDSINKSSTTIDPESELAKAKMEQSGLPVRETTEDSSDTLPSEITSMLVDTTDIADLFDASSKTVITFAPNEIEKTVRFRVIEDNKSEGQEIIGFLLAYPDDDTALIEDSRYISIIIEDDEPVEASKVSFSQPSYDAGTKKVTLVLTRSGAEYTYATVGVHTIDGTAKSGVNYEELDLIVSFAQYQTTATIEIPVGTCENQTDFSVELYEYQGIEPGTYTKATITIPSGVNEGESLLLKSSSNRRIRIWLNDAFQDCELVDLGHGGWNSIVHVDYIDGRENRVEVGRYRCAQNIGYSYFETDKGKKTHQVEGDYLHLEVYNSNVGSKGASGVNFVVWGDGEDPQYYSSMFFDYETTSDNQSSLFRVSSGNYSSSVTGKIDRNIGMGVTIPDLQWGYVDYRNAWGTSMFVEKTGNVLRQPGAKIYGYVLMYQQFDVTVVDPDPLEYTTGEFDNNGNRIKEKRLPAHTSLPSKSASHFYSKQSFHINEEGVQWNGTEAPHIYGELVGYEITPKNGTTFTYYTNSKTLTFDLNLIKKINENSRQMFGETKYGMGEGFRYFTTQITVKPVYKYKDAIIEIEAPDVTNVDVTYKDKDLQKAWNEKKAIANVFHVGDTINPSVTTSDSDYYYTGYWRYRYVNYGDTTYLKETSGHVQASTTPKTTLTTGRTVIKPVFEKAQNFIEIKVIGDASKYFKIANLVSDEYKQPYMIGTNVLNTGTTDNPSTIPIVGQAYSVLLTNTDENDGTWRPKITLKKNNLVVNGYSVDFIASDSAPGNVIEIEAEKINTEDFKYYSISGKAIYMAYSIRESSDVMQNIPATGASVTAGGESILWNNNYYKDGVKYTVAEQTNIRRSNVTNLNGEFKIDGIYAKQGDTISVLIDVNGIHQVAYIKLNSTNQNQTSIDIYEIIKGENKITKVEKTVTNQSMPVISMPICTAYSPYISHISYEYDIENIDTYSNEIPIYGGMNNLYFYIDLIPNGATNPVVKLYKRNLAGEENVYSAEKSGITWKPNCWVVSISGSALHDGDEFWVQIIDGNNQYPKLKTGLECYLPQGSAMEQRFTYELPSPYDSLPIVKSMSGTLDSGICNWQTIYDRPSSPATSNYAQLITMVVSAGEKLNPNDLLSKKNKLDSLKNQESQLDPHWIIVGQDTLPWEDQMDLEDTVVAVERGAWLDNEYNANLNGDALAKLKEPQMSGKFELLVQLEYAYDPETQTHYYSGGQYLISAAFNITSTLYWSVMGVPMYLNWSGTMSIQFDGRFATEQGKITAKQLGQEKNLAKAVQSNNPYFQWTIRAAVQPGVGIFGVLGVRGYLSFTILCRANMYKNNAHLNGTMGQFNGGFGVDLIVFSFTKLWPTTAWTSGVFDVKNRSVNNLKQLSNDLSGSPVSIRAFDNGEERVQNLLRSTLTPNTRTTLIDGAMEYVRPQLIDLGDGRTMMIFLRNTKDDGRNTYNASTLVYAIRNSNGTWEKDSGGNILSTIVETDNQADSVPVAYKVGDKVYIAWTNANIVGIDEFEDAKLSLKNTQIHMSVYDIKTGEMSKSYIVTNDDYVNSYAHIIERQGYIILYYFKRDITNAQGLENLASLTSNYNTWALRIFDPSKGEFVGDEELLYVKHPTVLDPLVFNLETGKYTYTDKNEVTKKYGLISYITDLDGDLLTSNDRELWVIVRNQTDGRAYYPIKIDSDKLSISDARLTEQDGELYLTWLTNGTTINTLKASDVWSDLDNYFGSEDGYGEITGLDLVRNLTDDEIAVYNWNELPYNKQPVDVRDNEFYVSLANLAKGKFPIMTQQLGEDTDEDTIENIINDHKIVAGKDGNLYYFWTQPSENGKGQELYGIALYSEKDAENGSETTKWSNPVRLTDYGVAIDELTIIVNEDNHATMIANLFEQYDDEEKGIAFGPHKLTEITFVPGSSLIIENQVITLSDEYPIPGEKVSASLEVKNVGLLPSSSLQLTTDENEELISQIVLPGDSIKITKEKTAGEDELVFNVNVKECDNSQILTVKSGKDNTAIAKTKTGYLLNFGTPEIITYNEAAKEIGPVIRYLMDASGKEWNDEEVLNAVASSVDPKYMAILSTLNCPVENRQKADLYVVVPVTNIGNMVAENITFTATEMHEQIDGEGEDRTVYTKAGDVVGSWTLDEAPVKTLNEDGIETKTIYVAIPLVDFNFKEDMGKLGITEIKLEVTQDEKVINNKLNASRQFIENVYLDVNNEVDEINLNIGEIHNLNAVAYPYNSLKSLNYEIEDGDVASVSQDGTITALKGGDTVIKVTDLNQPNLVKTVNITVNPNKYAVTFVNDDGTVLQSGEVIEGETPEYTGKTPTKEANVQYTYTFEGWTPDISEVTGAITYKATYTAVVNKYKIDFVDEEGRLLQSGYVNYGEIPEFKGKTPTKSSDDKYTYTFVRWTPNVKAVTGDKVYKAVFSTETNEYRITFLDEDGTRLQSEKVAYGKIPVYYGKTPEKESTDKYSYTFAGWNTEIGPVVGDTNYYATYTANINKYVITFVDEDGTLLQRSEYEYGDMPVYIGKAPIKENTKEYTYKFAGWASSIESVKGEATYIAIYTKTLNRYSVTFETNGGSNISPIEVEYGKTITKPNNPEKQSFIFDGWYKDSDLTIPFDFDEQITSDIKVYAKWVEISYPIVSGEDSEWREDSGKDLILRISRSDKDDTSFEHFTGVSIDGKLLKRDKDYTATKGSTIITLKAETLKTLSTGKHIITVNFDDGKVETNLDIKAVETIPTKDNNNIWIWIVVISVSIAIIAVVVVIIIKKKTSKK